MNYAPDSMKDSSPKHSSPSVIDYYRNRRNPAASPQEVRGHIRLDRDDVVKEVEAEGFHLTKQFDHLPFMYVLVFEKR